MEEQGKKTILIIDDVKLFQLFLKYTLSPDNYELIFADTGKQGLDIIMEKDVDLLILDLELPDKCSSTKGIADDNGNCISYRKGKSSGGEIRSSRLSCQTC